MQKAKPQLKNQNFKRLKKELPGVKKNVLLKDCTTFKIGGPAEYFYPAKNKDELVKAILAARKLKLPFFILAGGSNLLAADEGRKGLVIRWQAVNCKLQIQKARPPESLQAKRAKGKARNPKIFVKSGISLSELVGFSLKNSLSGMEWASGIPGTVGGAVHGNTGAFGKSISEAVISVEAINFDFPVSVFSGGKGGQFSKKGRTVNLRPEVKFLKNKECKFGYRDSIFKKKKNLVILSAEIELKKGRKKEIENKVKEYLNYKKQRQPLNFPSAGSIFKNPQLTIGEFKLLTKIFPETERFKKDRIIPAGWLIEKCNLKGKKIGNAQVSEKHANFIVNLGGAASKDARALIDLAKREVKKKFGVSLKEEIDYLKP